MAREERDGFPIVYSETRAQRLDIPDDVCVVCEEQTCPVVDQIHLPGDDVAWFTPNLYPITYPHEEAGAESRGMCSFIADTKILQPYRVARARGANFLEFCGRF